MRELKASEPDYGNWMPRKILYLLGAVCVLLLALSVVFPALIVVAALFIVVFAFVAYMRYQLSPRGGDVQTLIRELVVDRLEWDGNGRALDIGCGNAPLAIAIAKRFPNAHVTGIDYWGGRWEYSQRVCERNAVIEGVAGRTNFQKASASALPFEAESFDAAVSNLAFHEVRDAKDKRDVIKEALRVVKKGGAFAFQDLFLMKRVYGDVDELLETIRSWDIENVELTDTSHSDFIPKALRPSLIFGAIGILHGRK